MLHRQDAEGLVVISQPAHAWVSGQLARAWGNRDFPRPSEEVCLAAEQHDVGFLDWELNPTLNPETGLPHSFMELPTRVHLEMWSKGIRQMLRYGRYPALLVSMHFAALAKGKQSATSPEERKKVAAFLETQDEFQTTLTTSLQNDFYYAARSDEAQIRRDQEAVSMWDWMSLLLCLRFQEGQLPQVPARDRPDLVKMTPLDPEASRVAVEPWPFSGDRAQVVCDGRRLLQTYADESRMREALRAAAPVTVRIELVRG